MVKKVFEINEQVFVLLPPNYFGESMHGQQLIFGYYKGSSDTMHKVTCKNINNETIIIPIQDNFIFKLADKDIIMHFIIDSLPIPKKSNEEKA